MLDIGWPELMLVAVITVLVVGPKELPRVLRTFTFWVRKMQGMAREFQTGMNELARQSDLDDIRKDMKKVAEETTESLNVDKFDKALDPDNSIAGMFTGKAIRAPAAEAGAKADATGKAEPKTEEAAPKELNVAVGRRAAQTDLGDEGTAAEDPDEVVRVRQRKAAEIDARAAEAAKAEPDAEGAEGAEGDTATQSGPGTAKAAPRPIGADDVPVDLEPAAAGPGTGTAPQKRRAEA